MILKDCPCHIHPTWYWAKGDIDKLTYEDYLYCRSIAKERHKNFQGGSRDGVFEKTPEEALRTDIMGACAEGAVLRYLGYPLKLSVDNYSIVDAFAKDVPGSVYIPPGSKIQIKARFADAAAAWDNLLIPFKETKKPGYEDTIFLCVHELSYATFSIKGFIWGSELKLFGRCDPKGHDRKANRELAFDVPVKEMHRLPFYTTKRLMHVRHGVNSPQAHTLSAGI